MTEQGDFFSERLRKLETIQNLGQDPFGGRFPKTCLIKEILDKFDDGKKIVTAGRLSAMRSMGKSVFCDLRDESGKIQLYVNKGSLDGSSLSLFECLDLGDILGAQGVLFKTKTGEVSIRVERIVCLSKSLRPMPEKWHGLKDVETRYRQRYLDLMSNDESREIFKRRSLVIRQIRRYLDERGYLEVETPMMHPIPGGAAGKPFKTHHEALGMDLYLRVAPELYLKKLLVGGFEKIYEINKSFRNEGISTRHNPEFTMIEVYTAYQDVQDVMALTEDLIRHAAQTVFGTLVLKKGDESLDLTQWERISFAKLMKDTFDISPEQELPQWIERLKRKGVKIEGKDVSRTQLINIVADLIEPGKKGGADKTVHPIFVTEYFSELSPLARRNPKNPLISDRFELYIGGMEVANGYSEQNNPIEQRRRFEEELKEKNQKTKADAIDEDFLLALEHGMPPAGGLGIGIDRLIMLLTHQASIREVILFPQMKRPDDVPRETFGK